MINSRVSSHNILCNHIWKFASCCSISFPFFQIHKVQQRVTVKKALALKYGEELARAKAVASKEIGKRKLEQDHLGVSLLLGFILYLKSSNNFEETKFKCNFKKAGKQFKSTVGLFLLFSYSLENSTESNLNKKLSKPVFFVLGNLLIEDYKRSYVPVKEGQKILCSL